MTIDLYRQLKAADIERVALFLSNRKKVNRFYRMNSIIALIDTTRSIKILRYGQFESVVAKMYDQLPINLQK